MEPSFSTAACFLPPPSCFPAERPVTLVTYSTDFLTGRGALPTRRLKHRREVLAPNGASLNRGVARTDLGHVLTATMVHGKTLVPMSEPSLQTSRLFLFFVFSPPAAVAPCLYVYAFLSVFLFFWGFLNTVVLSGLDFRQRRASCVSDFTGLWSFSTFVYSRRGQLEVRCAIVCLKS